MASLWKHPNSPYWTACYTNSLGRQVKRSTKQRNAKLARKIAEAWEEAESKGRARQLTTIQIQKFASDLAERVVGDTIEIPTVEKFLNDWLASKKAKDSSAGTIERYGNTIRLFIAYLGEFAKAQITSSKGSTNIVRLLFEVDVPSLRNKTAMAGRNFNLDLRRQTDLRGFLEAWRGAELFSTADEQLDLEQLVDAPAEVVLRHIKNPSHPRPYVLIESIYPPGALWLTGAETTELEQAA